MNTETLWNKITSLEGETFYTVTGLPFTYKVVAYDKILPFRNGKEKWIISVNLIDKALKLIDGDRTYFFKKIIASPYVYGILTDKRIKE